MIKLRTQFAEVGSDLGIEGLCLADEPPGVSAARKMTKVKEEVVETFLCLHLSELIGAPVTHIRRASPIVSAQDVLALDALGRIHLFEVKRERIKRDHVRQLGQYLLGYVFADPRGFWAEPKKYHEETVEDWAALIAGAYGDRDVRKMSVEQVLRLMGADAQRLAGHLLGHPLRPSWWDKRLTATQKSELRAKAVLYDARRGDIEHMDWEALVHLAERWAAKLDSSRLSADGAFVPRRPLVVWLVGTGLGVGPASPLHDIRHWRRSGLDARYLGLKLLRYPQRTAWRVMVEREEYFERDQLEAQLIDLAAASNWDQPPTLDLKFYVEAAPSKRGEHREFGQPLGEGARAYYTPKGQERTELRPSSQSAGGCTVAG